MNEIKSGDYVTTNGLYPSIERYFNLPLRVADVKQIPGNTYVFCSIGKEQIGFYIDGLKKVG
jgi:hypothetical protein